MIYKIGKPHKRTHTQKHVKWRCFLHNIACRQWIGQNGKITVRVDIAAAVSTKRPGPTPLLALRTWAVAAIVHWHDNLRCLHVSCAGGLVTTSWYGCRDAEGIWKKIPWLSRSNHLSGLSRCLLTGLSKVTGQKNNKSQEIAWHTGVLHIQATHFNFFTKNNLHEQNSGCFRMQANRPGTSHSCLMSPHVKQVVVSQAAVCQFSPTAQKHTAYLLAKFFLQYMQSNENWNNCSTWQNFFYKS